MPLGVVPLHTCATLCSMLFICVGTRLQVSSASVAQELFVDGDRTQKPKHNVLHRGVAGFGLMNVPTAFRT